MAFSLKTLTLAAFTAVSSLTVMSPAQALDAAQKSEIGTYIREYLMENPELLMEVQEAYKAKMEGQRLNLAKSAASSYGDQIFNAPYDIALGNPDGDVTLVEFFDYNCGYCKRAKADIDAIISSDKNVRVIVKEFPILGPDSIAAHEVSNAVRNVSPKQYGEFQRTLLGSTGRANEDSAIELAVSLGINEADLRKSMKDKSQEESVRQTYDLATALGIQGTPSYVIGGEAIYGAVGVEALQSKIDNMRKCGKTDC